MSSDTTTFATHVAGDTITHTWRNYIQNRCPTAFTIYKDGSTYYAFPGESGETIYAYSDASTVIQYAITNAATGSKVFLKNATYPCHDLILKDYVVLEGESRYGAILQLNSNSASILKSHTDPTTAAAWCRSPYICHLGLDGNKATYATGLYGLYGWFGYANFEDLYIHDFAGHNVYLMRKAGDYSYENRIFNIHSAGSSASGFYSDGPSDSHLIMSEIHNNASHSVYIYGAVWHVISNYIGHTTTDGAHGFYLEGKGSLIQNNQIDWSYEDHLHMKSCSWCNVSGNRFLMEGTTDATRSCIELEDSFENSIIGNHFDGVGATKAYCVKENGSPGNCYKNRIIGNVHDDAAITTAPSLIVGTSSETENDWQPYGVIATPVLTTYLKINGTGAIADNTEYTNSGCPKTIYMQDADTFDVYVNAELVFDDVNQASVYLKAGDTFKVDWTSALSILKVFGH